MEGFTEIFVWGLDNCGQLGLGGQNRGKKYASPVFCSFNILIKELSCGEDHSAFISDSGHVYCMGSNANGKLGIGDRHKLFSSSPSLVESLSQHIAIKVSCGWTHTAVITEEGLLFTWGNGEYGQLGNGLYEDSWTPKFVMKNTQDVSCGARHMGAVSFNTLYMCGSGEMGQLGTGRRQNEAFLVPVSNANVAQVSCGVFHTGFLSTSNEIFTMGGNSFGQLGIGNKKSSISAQKVPLKDCIRIICGNCSLAICSDGLYFWGTSIIGEHLVPRKLKVSSFPIIDAAIGGSFLIAIDSKCNVFSWGNNSNGELGLGDFECRDIPTMLTGFKGKKITKLAAGGNFVICLGMNNREKKEYKTPLKAVEGYRIPILSNRENIERYSHSPGQVDDLAWDSSNNKTRKGSRESFSKKQLGKVEHERDSYRNLAKDAELQASLLKNESKAFKEENFVLKSENKTLKEESFMLKNENKNLKEEIFLIKNEMEGLKCKLPTDQVVEKVKETYGAEIKSLKNQLEAHSSLQNDLERDLKRALDQNALLENSLEKAHKETSIQAMREIPELYKKIQSLEEERKRLIEKSEKYEERLGNLQILVQKTNEENLIMDKRTQELAAEVKRLNDFIQELQFSNDNLNQIVQNHESSYIAMNYENSELQEKVLQMHSHNKEIMTNFEKEVSVKAKEFKDKTIGILSGQKANTARNNTPDDREGQHSSRKDLSTNQQAKIKNAVAKILDSKTPESPLKNLRVSSPTRKSPDRSNTYRPLSQEFAGKTPSKYDIKGKIQSLIQNRSRIERKIKLLEGGEENGL